MRKGAEVAVVSYRDRLPYQTEQPVAVNTVRKTLARHEETVRRIVLLTVLYLLPAITTMKPVLDPDIWWHLRTGQWIVEHGAVPMTDPFSSYGMGKPWVAYSWFFDVLVYGLYQAFGLVGVVLYTVVFSLLIAVALHTLVRRLVSHFPSEVAITALGLCSLMPCLSPRPWLFTILFFIIELDILLTARRLGDTRRLLLLPPLFALWANTHIQFIYGLFVLGLATAEPIIDRLFHYQTEGNAKTIPFGHLLLVTATCAVATLATPYHAHLYRVVFELIGQTGPFSYILELFSLSFREPWDWFVLATTLGATFSLGWRREIRPFPLLLLATGAFLSFRARRDIWFVVIVAVTLIGTSWSTNPVVDRFALTKFRAFVVAAAIVVALAVLGRVRHISGLELESALAEKYPVEAAAVMEKHGYPGPLYNHFNWGGYLIWRLSHLPVALDGRTNVHGDERIERSLKTWAGKSDWASDPELTAARLIVAQVDHALTSLLRLDPRFDLVYEDKVAAVFIARPQPQQ